MVVETRIEVRGLKELSAAFKDVDSEIPKELQASLKAVASSVASRAASKVPRRSGKAAASIKPRASQKGAGIAFGGSAAEYMPWLDFGGRVGRNKSIARDFMPAGRYVYPAIAESNEEITAGVEEAVNDAAKKAGFETRGGV